MNKPGAGVHGHFQSYNEAVDWINGLIPFGIRPGLKRMELLLEKLENPHRRLKFIHVAGTNGKGSVCAYISSVLKQCGYRVGTFNSPYMERFTDRIRLNGSDIEDETLLEIINMLRPLVEEVGRTELGSMTMFEVTTMLAIVYFAKYACPDFVVWEAGLGGSLDCTNVVYPLVSVITNIGHDHMDVLGDTLEQVAAQKAGIIKPGVPVVSAASQPEVIEIIRQNSLARNSTLYLLNSQFNFEPLSLKENEQQFNFSGPFRSMERLTIAMNGAHQLENAAAAVMTLEVLRQYYAVIIDEEDLYSGLAGTSWPGRLEMVSVQPRILLDGAHNPEGAESLALALKEIYKYRKLHLMIGMLSTKNHPGFFRHILPLADTLIITEPDFRKKMPAQDLYHVIEQTFPDYAQRSIEIIREPEWKKALKLLKEKTEGDDLAVVTGTLYLVADVRAWIVKQSDCEKGW